MRTTSVALFAIVLLATAAQADWEPGAGPAPGSDLIMEAPIARWDEAIPLGNGLLGGLLWGGGDTVKLSLDRGDLWDLRRPDIFEQPDWNYATIQRLVAEGNQKEISRLFDDPYNDIPYPTKLPVARLEFKLPGIKIGQFSLDLKQALGRATFDGGKMDIFFSATKPVAMLRITGATPEVDAVASSAVVEKLGYPAAKITRGADSICCVQQTASGESYALTYKWVVSDGTYKGALTVTRDDDGTEGLRLVSEALAAGFAELESEHFNWWGLFWKQSSLRVPEPAVQRQYDLVQYFYGAASRRGAKPMPLQGVWTADEGTLPPWKGDYHHDLNTQLTYWAYLAAGHFEEGAAFLDFMWDLLPEHRKFAREFYGAPGAAIPGVMGLDGKALAGWSQYALSPVNGAWVAQAFDLHWRYTMDKQFLRERAYPYLTALAECYEALLKPGADGKLKLPLSSSPEIHDNRITAWLTPNSNFDLALLRWHFGALNDMAAAVGEADKAVHWKDVLARLDDFAVDEKTSALKVSPAEMLTESHRHHSHLMAIHPLGLLTVEGSERDRAIIDASLAQQEALGTSQWCGYSFSWTACMAARVLKPELAHKNLAIFVEAFVSRNGFHINGDQTQGKYSNFHYRPFTLEGNFAAAQAVHEMLLQSWGGTIRVFPAVPSAWADASFMKLRAEGGYEVSAGRTKGRTTYVAINATAPGTVRIRNPFEGPVTWEGSADIRLEGNDYVAALKAGEYISARMPEEGVSQ